jgi:L-asparaginase
MTPNSSILVIYTGGTIGMILDTESGALHPFDFGQLYEQFPVLKKQNFTIDCISFDPIVDSSNMNPEKWIKLASIIEENYEKYDGFIVLHGSDTMAYSASALSFILENLNKPVIFTGSQLPLGVFRTDGRENFITSVEIAAARIDDTPVVPEVAILFENRLLRGNRTIKFNAEHFQAFRSVNYPVLAEAGVHIVYNHNHILKPNFKKLKVHKNLDTNIAILKLFPGINRNTVDAILNIPDVKAIVLETFGTGNAPADRWLLNSLAKAIKKGIIVLNVTQCQVGFVEMGKYQTSVELKDMGVIGGYDITTESAVAKLMYLLGEYSREQTIELLYMPLRGEITLNPVN